MNKRLFQILSICGACISFYIGAGFATMQEVLQYEASYGSRFFGVILVVAAIYIYTNLSFATNGSRLKIARGGDIYGIYCGVFGKKFGKIAAVFFDYFSAFFCYMSFVVMCGGANATCTQQWGLPSGVGAIVLTALVVGTVILGLEGIVNTLGKVGPIIIAMILIVSIYTAITGIPNYSSNVQAVDAGVYSSVMAQVGNGNPLLSGASYGGFVILWFAAFLAEIGSKNNLKNVNLGMLLSVLFIFGAASVCCVALIGHINVTAAADIPAFSFGWSDFTNSCTNICNYYMCRNLYVSCSTFMDWR